MLGKTRSKKKRDKVKAELILVIDWTGAVVREFDGMKDAELWIAEQKGKYEIVPVK